MKKRTRLGLIVVLSGTAMVMVYGCTLDPWDDISYEEARKILGVPETSSSSVGGIGGVGGSSGAGGMGGMGGAPCTCTDDNNECTTDEVVGTLCPEGEESKCHQIKADEPCSLGWCSKEGQCRDCSTCTTAMCVKRCQGITCADDAQCKSSFCEQGFCCNEACDAGPCKTCNRPGVEGTCTRSPLGLKCGNNQACNSDGGCAATQLAPLGALCGLANQCTSNACRRDYCRSLDGEPCIEDIECNGNYCDPVSKLCQSCADPGVTCPGGGQCLAIAEFCQVFPGQPTSIPEECLPPAIISAFMCKLPEGESCSRHGECESNHCKVIADKGSCAPKCATDAHCPSGSTCTSNKVCTLLKDEYCIEPKFCQSNKCEGFPRKCQP